MESDKTVYIKVDGQKYLYDGVIREKVKNEEAHNRYKIKTVEDMLNAVQPESLPYFLKDLENLFLIHYETQATFGPAATMKEFTWIDSHETNIEMTVRLVDDPEDPNNDMMKEEIVQYLDSHCVKL